MSESNNAGLPADAVEFSWPQPDPPLPPEPEHTRKPGDPVVGVYHNPDYQYLGSVDHWEDATEFENGPLTDEEHERFKRFSQVLDRVTANPSALIAMPQRLVGQYHAVTADPQPYLVRAFNHQVIKHRTRTGWLRTNRRGSSDDIRLLDWESVNEEVNRHRQASYIRQKAQLQANRALAAETFKGARELRWDDMTEEVDWLVQGVIPRRATAFLVSKPNGGKTFVTVDLVCNLILGRPWLGMPTGDGLKVMYVLGEGTAGFRGRVEAWCAANHADVSDVVGGLTIVDSANLSSDACLEQLSKIANHDEVDFVIFDTYTANSGVLSEDDAALNQRIVNDAKEIRPGATVLFLHHPTKATENSDCPVMRGSGALAGTVDTVLTLYRDVEYMKRPGVLGPRFAISTDSEHGGKIRDAQPVTLRGFSIATMGSSAVLVRDADATIDLLSPAAMRVASYLVDGMTMQQYEAVTKVSHGTATNDLAAHAVKIPGTKPQQWKKEN